MKILSLLLLLTLGLGAAWWKQAHPDGTLADARSEADQLVARAGEVFGRARSGVVGALGLAAGATDESATGDDATAGDATAAAEPAPASSDESSTESTAVALADPDTLGTTDEAAEADETAEAAAVPPPAPEQPAPEPSAPEQPVAVTDGDDAAGNDAAAAALAAAGAAALATRLDTLETRVAEAAPDETLAARLDTLEARVTEAAPDEALVDRLDALEARLTEAPPEPDGALGERLDALEERLDTAATRDTETLDRLDITDERLTALADRLDTLGDTASATVADEPAAGGDTFAGDAPGSDVLAGRLDTLTDEFDRRLAELEALAGADGGTATARLDELDARVSALADRRDSVDIAQAAIRAELLRIDEQVDDETAGDDASALGVALESTRARLTALETRVQAIPESSAEAEAAQSTQEALEAQVSTLTQRLEGLATNDPALADSISAVREQVDELANSDFVTQEELRAQAEGRNVEYKIYFDVNQTEISEEAARVLDSFITQEQNRTTGVSIFGFTDRRGAANYNQRLALERATNVRSYLIRNGLPYTKVRALSGLGEDAAAAILPDDADDAQQRVVVLYAAQP